MRAGGVPRLQGQRRTDCASCRRRSRRGERDSDGALRPSSARARCPSLSSTSWLSPHSGQTTRTVKGLRRRIVDQSVLMPESIGRRLVGQKTVRGPMNRNLACNFLAAGSTCSGYWNLNKPRELGRSRPIARVPSDWPALLDPAGPPHSLTADAFDVADPRHRRGGTAHRIIQSVAKARSASSFSQAWPRFRPRNIWMRRRLTRIAHNEVSP